MSYNKIKNGGSVSLSGKRGHFLLNQSNYITNNQSYEKNL